MPLLDGNSLKSAHHTYQLRSIKSLCSQVKNKEELRTLILAKSSILGDPTDKQALEAALRYLAEDSNE